MNSLSLFNPIDSYALARRNAVSLNSVPPPSYAINPYTPAQNRRNARRRLQRQRAAASRNPLLIPRNRGRVNLSGNFIPFGRMRRITNSFYNGDQRTGEYIQGGLVQPSTAVARTTRAPQAIGFSLTNSGERNVTYSKEFVAGFLRINRQSRSFTSFEITTHPSLNSSVVAVAQIYQRYKILSYAFKYKSSCATTTSGLHYTGVDYGTQVNLPNNFEEAETLEHFTVGPIWKDSENWHVLKLSNLKERWFETRQNAYDPESRPARIIYGALGVNVEDEGNQAMGLIEVRVTYLFNGLAQSFTKEPRRNDDERHLDPNAMEEDIIHVETTN